MSSWLLILWLISPVKQILRLAERQHVLGNMSQCCLNHFKASDPSQLGHPIALLTSFFFFLFGASCCFHVDSLLLGPWGRAFAVCYESLYHVLAKGRGVTSGKRRRWSLLILIRPHLHWLSTCCASMKAVLVCKCVCVCVWVFRIDCFVKHCISIHACLYRQAFFFSVCVCVCLEVTHAGRGGSVYIGSLTRGNEVTSKRVCSWTVEQARESPHAWSGRQTLQIPTDIPRVHL